MINLSFENIDHVLHVSVQSLDKGCLHITDVTLPRLVVLVVSVRVVNQSPETPTLLLTDLTDAELLIVLRDFSLGMFTEFLSTERIKWFYSWSSSLFSGLA